MGTKISELLPLSPDVKGGTGSGGRDGGGKMNFLIDSFVTKSELVLIQEQFGIAIDDIRKQRIHAYASYQADVAKRDGEISQLNNYIGNLTLDIDELEKAMIEKENKFNKKLRTQESWTIVFGLLLIVLFIWTIVITLK